MLPLRIELEGFRTFREKTAFAFEGEALWAITGKNGSGKSTVFEAMVFALYGEHRGGIYHNEQVISQGKDRASVVFEFSVGPNVYQVERTVSRRAHRRGESTYERTCLARRVVSRVGDSAAEYEVVAHTADEDALKEWVQREIGLTCKAFTASVLLQQGRADAFILAKPRDRQDILLQLLDLEEYKVLETVAKERARTSDQQLKGIERDFEPLAGATGEALDAARKAAEDQKIALDHCNLVVERAAGSLKNAESFVRASDALLTVRAKLVPVSALLARADDIERNAAEYERLNQSVPVLTRIVGYRRTVSNEREAAISWHLKADGIDVDALEEAASLAEAAERDAASQYDSARRARLQAAREAEDLAPVAAAARELDDEQTTAASATRDIASLSADLSQRPESVRYEQLCDAADRALASLRSLKDQRALASGLQRQLGEVQVAFPAQLQAVELLRRQALDADVAHQNAADEVVRLTRDLAVAEQRADAAGTELTTRQDAASEGTCSRCGQRVDAAHIAREIAEASDRLARFQAEEQEVRTAKRDADDKESECLRAKNDKAAERDRGEATLVQLGNSARDLKTRLEEACRLCGTLAAGLPEPYRSRAQDEAYPSQAAVDDAQGLASQLEAAREERQRLDNLRAQSDVFEGHRSRACQRVQELQNLHAGVDLPAQLLAYQAACERRATLEDPEQKAWERWDTAKPNAAASALAAKDGKAFREQYLTQASQAEDRAAASESAADEWSKTLDLDWLAVAPTEAAALDLLLLREEELVGASDRKAGLDEARRVAGDLSASQEQLLASIETIPEDDRIAVEAAQSRLADARSARDEASTNLGAANAKVTSISEALARRAALESQCRKVGARAADLKLLANYFGRSNLQAWIIQEAQLVIGDAANEYLRSMSDGMLTLTVQPVGDELELRVTDLSSGQEPMDASCISGSQQFRVAVALALAIGQYSGGGSRDIRSVLIDEGFGGLDEDGRREMIAQLKSLEGVLDRVILVSHQEDFQTAFPNGYHIQKTDGVSRIMPRVGSV